MSPFDSEFFAWKLFEKSYLGFSVTASVTAKFDIQIFDLLGVWKLVIVFVIGATIRRPSDN